MVDPFDESRLIANLDALPEELRVAFAVACASGLFQMLVNSHSIAADERGFLSNTSEELWRSLRPAEATAGTWDQRLEFVMSVLRRVNDQGSDDFALLDDGLSALAYAIRTRINGKSQEAAWCARRCYEYADTMASDESALLNDDPVQLELTRQSDIETFLKTVADRRLPVGEHLDELRRIAAAPLQR